MSAGRETALLKACMDVLTIKGCTVWRQNSGMMPAEYKGRKRFIHFTRGVKGISDIIGWMPDGRFIAVETKIKGNKPTDEQRAFLARVNRSGGLGILAYSQQDVFDALEGKTPAGLVRMPT